MNLPIFFIIFVISLVIVLLVINQLVSVNNPNAEKLSPYECGFSPLGDARQKFTVQFYLVGILFLIFDLEVLFLLPFAVSLYQISIYGFWVILIFLVILTIGFVYELAKGALKFSAK
jgi:NADH-quinone oxidoreductase subunit A